MGVYSCEGLQAIWDRVVEHNIGYVLSAYLDSRSVASALFLNHEPNVVYKLSASEPQLIAQAIRGRSLRTDSHRARGGSSSDAPCKTELGHEVLEISSLAGYALSSASTTGALRSPSAGGIATVLTACARRS
jgi:hypothetical protein